MAQNHRRTKTGVSTPGKGGYWQLLLLEALIAVESLNQNTANQEMDMEGKISPCVPLYLRYFPLRSSFGPVKLLGQFVLGGNSSPPCHRRGGLYPFKQQNDTWTKKVLICCLRSPQNKAFLKHDFDRTICSGGNSSPPCHRRGGLTLFKRPPWFTPGGLFLCSIGELPLESPSGTRVATMRAKHPFPVKRAGIQTATGDSRPPGFAHLLAAGSAAPKYLASNSSINPFSRRVSTARVISF